MGIGELRGAVAVTIGLVHALSLAGPTMGQEPSAPPHTAVGPWRDTPRDSAEVFLPGIVSSEPADEYGLAVDHGWTELYFTRLKSPSSVIMTSWRTADFANEDGSWTAAVNLGQRVNSPQGESSPTLSADGSALFFSRAGQVWWISTRVIEEARPVG
jgi:hypothetical protein